jgi:hypothetical protein
MGQYTAICFAPNCTRIGNLARGFCAGHFREFKAACVANGSWSSKEDRDEMQERMQQPERPKWEYEPTPEQDAELIEKYGGTKQ